MVRTSGSEPPWVLVDSSYLAHRALHSVGGLSRGGVGRTGVVFGFLTQLRAICEDERVRSNRVVAFLDSRESLRRDAYPAYKANRRPERDEDEAKEYALFLRQVRQLESEVLPQVGVQTVVQRGLESDDLMAEAARWVRRGRQTAVLVTGDSDLWQCISRRVSWFDHGRSAHYDGASFQEAKGVPPRQWGTVKILAGDATDNVRGVGGVGVKTAVRYLRGELKSDSAAVRKITGAAGDRARAENGPLVLLPHAATKPFELVPPEWSWSEFQKVCEHYGFHSFLRDERGWRRLFSGQLHRSIRGALTRRGE